MAVPRPAHFLDGVALKQWTKAGYAVFTEPRPLDPARYETDADPNFLWTTEDVKAAGLRFLQLLARSCNCLRA